MYDTIVSLVEQYKEQIASVLLMALTLSFMFTFEHLTDVVLACSLLMTSLLYKRDTSIRKIYQNLWHEGRIFFILIGLVGVGYLVSTLFTGMHRESFTVVRKTVQWMVYPIVLTFFLGSISKRTETIIKVVVGGSIIFMCINLLYQGLVLHINRPDEWITQNYCNISAGIISCLLFFFFTKRFTNNTYYKVLSISILVLSGAALAVLKSRGAFFALGAAIICMFIYGIVSLIKHRTQVFFKWSYILLALSFIGILFIPMASQDNMVQRTKDSVIGIQKVLDRNTSKADEQQWILRSGGDRVYLIQSTMEMIKDHPVFGVGLSQFNTVYVQQGYILPEAKEPNLKSPHNIFLHVLVETGIVGFIPIISLWLYMIYYTVQSMKRKTPYGMAVLLALVVIFVHGLFDYVYFYRSQNQILFFYMAFLIWQNAVLMRGEKY